MKQTYERQMNSQMDENVSGYRQILCRCAHIYYEIGDIHILLWGYSYFTAFILTGWTSLRFFSVIQSNTLNSIRTWCALHMRQLLCKILCSVDHAALYYFVNKINLVHNLFLVYLSNFTCFGRLCAHHREKQLCLCDTWYLLFCMDDSLVCKVGPCIPDSHSSTKCHINTVAPPYDGHIVTRNM